MDAVYTSETSVYFYETTQHLIPQGCHLWMEKALLQGNSTLVEMSLDDDDNCKCLMHGCINVLNMLM
jgi:hypothetical protein